MNEVPEPILACLHELHVLSLAVCCNDIPWSANAFYAYDAQVQRLIFLSALDTRHAQMLAINHRVAGTIAAQILQIDRIHGLQFHGIARELRGPEEAACALHAYYQRFPQARGMSAPVWEIRLLQLKLTDNRLGFGTKVQWSRDDTASRPHRHATAATTMSL